MAYVRERGKECEAIRGKLSFIQLSSLQESPTVAPILPLMVMTRPMIVLPRTQAPMAILQLRPTAMMEEAMPQKRQNKSNYLLSLARS